MGASLQLDTAAAPFPKTTRMERQGCVQLAVAAAAHPLRMQLIGKVRSSDNRRSSSVVALSTLLGVNSSLVVVPPLRTKRLRVVLGTMSQATVLCA